MRDTNSIPAALAMAAQGLYLSLPQLLSLCPEQTEITFYNVLRSSYSLFTKARGSSHNHQDWEGGYIDHIVETMNIACKLYTTLDAARALPFTLASALEVIFWHDIEKPFKDKISPYTKENRREFRAKLLNDYNIRLTEDQLNAIRYIEGVPDSEYTPGERTMGKLAAFCHCCDIISARLWHDKGKDPNYGFARW